MLLDASGPLGATQNVQTLAGVWKPASKSLPSTLQFKEQLSGHTRRAIHLAAKSTTLTGR
jgi:hypothetical protein